MLRRDIPPLIAPRAMGAVAITGRQIPNPEARGGKRVRPALPRASSITINTTPINAPTLIKPHSIRPSRTPLANSEIKDAWGGGQWTGANRSQLGGGGKAIRMIQQVGNRRNYQRAGYNADD